MRIRNQRRQMMKLLLFILLVSISMGYAFLRTELTINGTADFLDARWDIHFANLVVNPNSVELSTGNTAAIISASTTEVTYAVTLKEPGDFYEFTVDAVNNGTMDAMIDTISSKMGGVEITSLPAYMEYSVTYSDDTPLVVNQYLKAGTTETYKVHIGFKKDINASDLTGQVESKSFSFSVAYVQADSNGVEVVHPINGTIYTINNYNVNETTPKYNSVWLNEEYPRIIPYFETPAEALSAIATASGQDLPYYLKHKLVNGIVTESYVEFIVTEGMAQANSGMVPGTYALRGVKSSDRFTYIVLLNENDIIPYYEANKETMKTAFGYATDTNRCEEDGTGNSTYFSCSSLSLTAYTDMSGSVSVHKLNNPACNVDGYGYSFCQLQ